MSARTARTARTAGAAKRRRTTAPTTTSVNLLSPWVLEELHVRRLRARFVLGALVLLLVVGGTCAVLRMSLGRAEQALADEQAVGDGLAVQISGLADVRSYVENVNLRSKGVTETMAGTVVISRVTAALDEALPAGADLGMVTITLPPQEALSDGETTTSDSPACDGSDPFGARELVGCVELKGRAANRADVSALVQALADNGMFVEPFVDTTMRDDDGTGPSLTEHGFAASGSGKGGDGVLFEGSVGLDASVLSDRYDVFDPARQAPDADTDAVAESDESDESDESVETAASAEERGR